MSESEPAERLDAQSDALIVFARAPRPGEVKTRLTDVLSEEEASRLYRAFLADSLRTYAGMNVRVRLYVAPPAAAFPRALIPADAERYEQEGEGLGARMQRAFAETLGSGHRRAVIVGTDLPSLPPVYVVRAFEALTDERRVAVGPSGDGGYYLLGMRRFYPEVFGDSYGHRGVLEDTLGRIARAGAVPVVLPEWYDVDRPSELVRLRKDLEAHPERAPRTGELLETVFACNPRLAGGNG